MMKKKLQLLALIVLACSLVACAATGNGAVKTLTQDRAAQTIVIGKSTKAQINEAFGKASITTFSNGYELWLYQMGYSKAVDSMPYVNLFISSANNKKELSILFDQSGVVKKYQLKDEDE